MPRWICTVALASVLVTACDPTPSSVVGSNTVSVGGTSGTSGSGPRPLGNLCATNAECSGPTSVCNSEDGVCEAPCSSNVDCTNFLPSRQCFDSECLDSTFEGTQCPTVNYSTSSTTGPLIWAIAPSSEQDESESCVGATGTAGTLVTFQGSYLSEGAAVPTNADGGTDLDHLVLLVSPSGELFKAGANAAFGVGISASAFTFNVCNPSSNVEAGVILFDSVGDASNVACLPVQ